VGRDDICGVRRKVLDGGMNREIYSIKGNPRHFSKAPGFGLTLAMRLRLSPANKMSCGTQPANIRLANRRVKFPFSFHHYIVCSLKKRKRKYRFDLDRVAHHIRKIEKTKIFYLTKHKKCITLFT